MCFGTYDDCYMKWNKLVYLLICLMIGCVYTTNAIAFEIPIQVAMSVNPNRLLTPQTVEVAIKITNVADEDLPGTVSLLDPAGNVVTSFGDGGSITLRKGASVIWTGTWDVTDKQLKAGKIRYQVKYPVCSEDGSTIERKNLYFTYAIKHLSTEPLLDVKRTISPSLARIGDTIKVTYEVDNVGTYELTDIVIRESGAISNNTQYIRSLQVNAKERIEFEAQMQLGGIVSEATITYASVKDETSYECIIEPTIIKDYTVMWLKRVKEYITSVIGG